MLSHTTPTPGLFSPSPAPTTGQPGCVTEQTGPVPSPDAGRASAPADTGPAQPAPVLRELLRVEEAAHRLSIGRTTMFALIRDRVVDSVKIGRRRLVPADALTAYINRLTAQRRPAAA